MVDQGFEEAVVAAIRSLSPGEIATYGEIAAEAGRPGAARAVGRVLATTTEDVPWWRVVTASARLVPGHEARHAELLRAEGVDASDGRVRPAETRSGSVGCGGPGTSGENECRSTNTPCAPSTAAPPISTTSKGRRRSS